MHKLVQWWKTPQKPTNSAMKLWVSWRAFKIVLAYSNELSEAHTRFFNRFWSSWIGIKFHILHSIISLGIWLVSCFTFSTFGSNFGDFRDRISVINSGFTIRFWIRSSIKTLRNRTICCRRRSRVCRHFLFFVCSNPFYSTFFTE